MLTPPEKPNQEPTTTTTATPHTSSPSNPPATSVPTTSKHPNTNTNTPHHHHHHHLLLHSPNEDEEPPPPSYSIFALTDIKSRLPLPFLNRSLHLITLITLTQIILGVTTGILLNLPGVGASGGAILLLIPWIYNIASACRRFTRIAKTIHLLSTLNYSSSSSSSSSPKNTSSAASTTNLEFSEKLPDITVSESWERTTTRQGKVCYVHHGHRKTMWSVPVPSPGVDGGAGGGGGGGGIHGNDGTEGTSPQGSLLA